MSQAEFDDNIIAREAETLPLEKQVEILDFLKTRESPVKSTSKAEPQKTPMEIEAFFRSFNVDAAR